MENKNKPPKKNGFEKPYDELQILSWILFPSFVIFWFFMILPVLATPLNIILTAIFAGLFVTIIVYAYKTIVSNPMDRYQQFSKALLNGINAKHCYVCNRDVFPLSLHCRLCRKCVDGFDHHCKWLNTCIGRHNYKIFYITLSSATYLVVFEVIVEICLIVAYAIDKEPLRKNLSIFYNNGASQENDDGSIDSWFIGLCVMTALMLPICFLLVQLWTFHVGLLHEKTTTYAYLRDLQQKKAERLRNKRLGINNDKKKKKKKKKNNDDKAGGSVYPADYNDGEDIIQNRNWFESIFFCASNDRSNLMHLPFENDVCKAIPPKTNKDGGGDGDDDNTTTVVSAEDIRLPEKVGVKTSSV